MSQVSSGWTKFHKYVLPLAWLAALMIVAVNAISKIFSGRVADLAGGLGSVLIAALGFVSFRSVGARAADVVLDEGDALIVRKGKVEQRISLKEVMEVRYEVFYPQVALVLRNPGVLGQEVTFIPVHRVIPWARHPAILGLMKRVADGTAG